MVGVEPDDRRGMIEAGERASVTLQDLSVHDEEGEVRLGCSESNDSLSLVVKEGNSTAKALFDLRRDLKNLFAKPAERHSVGDRQALQVVQNRVGLGHDSPQED